MTKRAEQARKRMEAIEEMLLAMKEKVGDSDALSVLAMILLEIKDFNDRLAILESEVGPADSFIEVDGPSTVSPRLE